MTVTLGLECERGGRWSRGAALAVVLASSSVAAENADPEASTPPAGPAESTPADKPGSPEAPDRAPATDEGIPMRTEANDAEARERWRVSRPGSELPERAKVLALTVAGGVSLGSFEAGQVNLLADALRESPGSARLMITTGASAGSANALIAGTTACMSRASRAEESLGYRVWVPVGLDQLFDPARVTGRSLFVDDGLKRGVRAIADEWASGLPNDCEFVVAIAATRAQGLDVQLTEGLVVPRQSERFVIHVTGRNQLPPRFDNYVDPKRSFERPLLPLSGGSDLTSERDFSAVADAALASAAFPVAFPEHVVPHCVTPRGAQFENSPSEPPRCDTPTRRDAFVDGGVFDNNPLGISYNIARNGLRIDGDRAVFKPVPDGPSKQKPDIVYGYIDPDLTRYPQFQPSELPARERDDPLLGILMRFSDQALNTARGQELSMLAERNPVSLRRLWLVQTGYPPISGLLGAFLGFFERDFRDFDFHLGEYDSFYELRQHTGTILGTEPFIHALEGQLKGPAASVPAARRKLGCLLSRFEPETYGHLAPLCGGEELRNFRVLLQVALDRLWSNCRRVKLSDNQRKAHLQCAAARDGVPAPMVDPAFRVRGARYQGKDEADFDYAIRLLSDYGFHFRDLGLEPDESDRARLEIRRRLVSMVENLADAQPDVLDRMLILTGGRTVVNGIEYEPPRDRVYALLGGYLALGSLHRAFGLSWLYANPDLRANNIRSLFNDRAQDFSGTLSAGFEVAVLPLSGNVYQTSFGLRAGYQFSGNDNLGTIPCDDSILDPRHCSTLVLHAPFNFTLFERMRLNLTPMFYPLSEPFGHEPFGIEWGLGAIFF